MHAEVFQFSASLPVLAAVSCQAAEVFNYNNLKRSGARG
jgi:hypothetical protein